MNQVTQVNETPASPAMDALGKMGIDAPWKVALLIPASYDDITNPVTSARELVRDQPKAFTFLVASPVSTGGGRGPPRATFMAQDTTGSQFRTIIFGNAKGWADNLQQDHTYTFMATAKAFSGEWNITLKEPVEAHFIGHVRPTYPGRRSKLPASYIREVIRSQLPSAIRPASQFIEEKLAPITRIETILDDLGCADWTLDQVLAQTHAPDSPAYAAHARRVYLRIAALGALARLHLSYTEQDAKPLLLSTLDRRLGQVPFTLTEDQREAIGDIRDLLNRTKALRHVVAGDVGCGKTIIGCVIAASTIDAIADGGRALVMAPNATVASQFRAEFQRAFPDIATTLVTGESRDDEGRGTPMVFGTSAVLFRNLGHFDIVIIDEQQSWSRAQREHYTQSDNHLIELSATCVPRTQALIRFGRVTVSELRQTHKPKNVRTRLWQGSVNIRRLMRGINGVVQKGRPVIVVYPKREATGKGADKGKGTVDDRYSVEAAYPRWEKLFPGRVRAITSDDDAQTKNAALQDLDEGRASILLATTVVQVGLNINSLRNLVIAHPDRHGLTALHQLRGRVARQGGDGFCELLVLEALSKKARARLDALMSTTDGFALAEMDLELRGTGDMGKESGTQSGADQTFLYGIPLSVEMIEDVQPLWEHYLDTRNN